MFSAAPSILVDIGAVCGALLAVGALCALLARSRPVRWVGRTLLAEPAARWFRVQVQHVVEPALAEIRSELRPNGHSPTGFPTDRTFRDEVREFMRVADERHESQQAANRKIFANLGVETTGTLEEADDPDGPSS